MTIIKKNMILDEVLETWQSALGDDFIAYKNHCYRVFNFYAALIAKTPMNMDKGAIAIAFHDLGIWSHQTFDYLAPSEQLAREYLLNDGNTAWTDEIVAMINNHHKIRAYHGNPLVEAMRKADWLDVSLGLVHFGLDKSLMALTCRLRIRVPMRSSMKSPAFTSRAGFTAAPFTWTRPLSISSQARLRVL